MKCHFSKCAQKGLTLLEVMVALTLGFFVIASILQIFFSTKQAYRLQDAISMLQENGRFSLDFLSRYIRMAGYRENRPPPGTKLPLPQDTSFTPQPPTAAFRPDSNSNSNFTEGQVLTGVDNDSNSHNAITFRYQGSSDGVVDCFGNPVLDNQMVTITFSLAPTDPNNPATDMSLRCQSTISPGPQPLVPGIADMQILYGVQNQDVGGNILGQQYMNATAVNAQNSWNNVISVKIALLLQSDDNITTQSQTYRFPPWDTGNPTTAKDLRLRRIFTTTVNLRNLTK
jgi:type IV pilus assembly protein PilW